MYAGQHGVGHRARSARARSWASSAAAPVRAEGLRLRVAGLMASTARRRASSSRPASSAACGCCCRVSMWACRQRRRASSSQRPVRRPWAGAGRAAELGAQALYRRLQKRVSVPCTQAWPWFAFEAQQPLAQVAARRALVRQSWRASRSRGWGPPARRTKTSSLRQSSAQRRRPGPPGRLAARRVRSQSVVIARGAVRFQCSRSRFSPWVRAILWRRVCRANSPDSSGRWPSGSAATAHRRLSTLRLESLRKRQFL